METIGKTTPFSSYLAMQEITPIEGKTTPGIKAGRVLSQMSGRQITPLSTKQTSPSFFQRYAALSMWQKIAIGIAATLVLGVAIKQGGNALYRCYFPDVCVPGVDPACMGPLLQRKFSLGIVEDNLATKLPPNPLCNVPFSSDKALEKQCRSYWHTKERNEMVFSVIENHAKYANKWGYEHRVQTGNLVAGECLDPDSGQAVDCAPYWNKIAFLRKWLDEPKAAPGTEEWHLFMDSDMVITNQTISLEQVIDALRNANESIIATRDGLRYQRNVGLVNTGLLLVRKDERAKEVLDAIWERRNDVVATGNPLCKTPGTCKTQQIVHEQESFGDVLYKRPSLYGDAVSISYSRDTGSAKRSAIALNTYHRPGGCILSHREGLPYIPFNYQRYASLDPNAQWQVGDFTGQVPVFPILGRELPFEPRRLFGFTLPVFLFGGRCIGDWDQALVTSVRGSRVEQMISQTIW